jgi:hypothetical protein
MTNIRTEAGILQLKFDKPSEVDFSWDEDAEGNLTDPMARAFEEELETLRKLWPNTIFKEETI